MKSATPPSRGTSPAALQHRVSPFASERIVFRTRDDILTDQRFITGGATYPLREIQAVRVVASRLYVPLQVARGVALFIATVLLVFAIAGLVIDLEISVHPLVYLALAVPFGLFAVAAGWFVPGYALRLTTLTGAHTVMQSSDFETLRAFAARIHASVARRDGSALH